ncbi:hypothetical protein [Ammoniphilus sp. 3BR4]|uniref:hypothetical protein n=1 Tax=Ammoniphilus sp. 3BR4 TaxID=3158265 RepID=UPI0034651E6F
METSVGIILVALAIIMIEVPHLLKKGFKKELWTFSILLLFGTGLSIAKGLQADLPNPLDWIAAFYKPMNDLLFGLLK